MGEPFVREMISEFRIAFPKYPLEETKDFRACFRIACKIGPEKDYNSVLILTNGLEYVLKRWGEIVKFITTDKWFSTRSLYQINNEWQSLIQSINSNGTHKQNNPKNSTSGGIVFDRP